jgi:hypothetical protein
MKTVLRTIAAAIALATATQAAALDVCAMLPRADAEAVVGTIRNVTTMKPQGSLLGECTFEGAKGTLSMAARPASEYEPTLKLAADKDRPPEAAQGLGGKAVKSKYGLLYQPAGKPYFLQVIARRGGDEDMAMALEGAKKLRQ